MRMRNLVLGITAIACLTAVAVAQTPARTPAELIRNRQASYKQLSDSFKVLFAQTKADAPSIDAIRTHSANVARIAPQVGGWFPPGTGPETGVPTRAKAELWANPGDFRHRSAALVVAARAVDAAARSGDIAAFRAAFPALRQSCADCHDRYRGPELPH
jgi:cytochrome c556